MSKGFVYILSNPSMPGIVKIGKTTRSVEARALELYQTGVPTPFAIAHSVLCPDCSALEWEMHDRFAERRVNVGREFFCVDVAEAIETLDRELHGQITGFVEEFMPDHTVIRYEMDLGDDFLFTMAEQVQSHPVLVVDAIKHLDAPYVQILLERRNTELKEAAERRRLKGAQLNG